MVAGQELVGERGGTARILQQAGHGSPAHTHVFQYLLYSQDVSIDFASHPAEEYGCTHALVMVLRLIAQQEDQTTAMQV